MNLQSLRFNTHMDLRLCGLVIESKCNFQKRYTVICNHLKLKFVPIYMQNKEEINELFNKPFNVIQRYVFNIYLLNAYKFTISIYIIYFYSFIQTLIIYGICFNILKHENIYFLATKAELINACIKHEMHMVWPLELELIYGEKLWIDINSLRF